MKMTRDQLKKIIKECLVEILMDGAGEALTERARLVSPSQQRMVPSPTQRFQNQPQPQTQARRPSVYDSMRVSNVAQPPQRVNEIISNATTSPLMASIFADTLQTTLVDQDSNGRAAPSGDAAARVVASYDPAALFGEEAQTMWNEAAFAPRNRLPGSLPYDHDPYAPAKKA